MVNQKLQKKTKTSETPKTPKTGLEARITFLLKEKGDVHTEVFNTGDRYIGRTHCVHGRKCLVAGEHNESDNCFFNIANDGSVFYHCFDGEHHERSAGVFLGNLYQRVAWENDMFIGVPEIHTDLWKQGTEVKIHDNEWVQAIKPIAFTKAYCITAGCGKGKSTAIASFVENLPESASVLVVTGRTSLSHAFKKLFPTFSHYVDENAYDASRLIVEYESLQKIKQSYDYIIV